MKTKLLLAAASVAIVALCAGYWWRHRPAALSSEDYLLVGDLANESGEKDFDGSIREALRVSLAQSPLLNLLSEEKTRTVLKKMDKPAGQRLDAVLAAALCDPLGARAYLTGKISRTGETYSVELEVHHCGDNARMAREEASAPRKDLLIHHVGVAAAKLREDLGENKESVEKLDCPLERATTPIPAALQAYEDARRAIRDKGDLEAVPYYKQAIDMDSRFALARSGLAVSYYNLNQMAQASEEIRQAYEAGDRQTLRERLNITTLYYDLAQGDVEKAIEGYKEYIRAYPHDDVALGNLSSEYFVVGDYEQAAKYSQAALKIDPDSSAWYENYSTALLALARVDEAEKVLNEGFSRNLDDPALHANMYSLAFLKGDTTLMQQQLTWAMGRANGEDTMLAAQSDTEAYFGRLQKAREFTQRAVAAAEKADLPESAATWEVEAGMREAVFGDPSEARKDAQEALKLAPTSKDVRALAALVLARAGDEAKAQEITDDLRALYVSNMAIQKAWLPVVRAQTAIYQKKNAEAVQLLGVVTPYEKGQLTGNLSDSCMIAAYLRGEAFLGLQQGPHALAEFQKIERNPGIIGNCWSGPVAKLGEARAEAQSGFTAEARAAYLKFFEIWKNADPDIPVLKQAKAEASKLH
jgi:eukaryotic-like serine/threonine-protein kinase